MYRNVKFIAHAFSVLTLMALPSIAHSQNYYDDDIYYDGAKAEKARIAAKQNVKPTKTSNNNVNYTGVVDYPGADTYVVHGTSTIDVDAYNRHGQFLVADTIEKDNNETDYFENTRRIEKFHNSDIVSGSNDEVLQAYYYTQPATVNIYVENNPWYYPNWSWSWTYNNPLYNWAWGYYDPWWNPVWGFTWNPGWGPGWGPNWSFTWGPGWYPGWYPGWGPSWGPGFRPGPIPVAPPRPQTGPGSSGTHAPTFAGGSTRPAVGSSAGTYRPGSTTTGLRPGQIADGTTRPGSNASRPGQSGNISNTTRPGQSGNVGSTSRPGQSVGGLSSSNLKPSYGSASQNAAQNGQLHNGTLNTATRPSQTIQTTTRPAQNNNASSNSSSPSRGRTNNSSSQHSSFNSGSSFGSGSHSSGGGFSGGNRGSGSTGGGGGRGRR